MNNERKLRAWWIAAVECAIEIPRSSVHPYSKWARVVFAFDEEHALAQVDRRVEVLNSDGRPVLEL